MHLRIWQMLTVHKRLKHSLKSHCQFFFVPLERTINILTGYTRIHLQTDIVFITCRQSLRRQSLWNFHTFKVHTYILHIPNKYSSLIDLNMKCHLSTFCEKEEYLIIGDVEMGSKSYVTICRYLQYQNTCMTMKVHYRFVTYLISTWFLSALRVKICHFNLIFTIIKVTVL